MGRTSDFRALLRSIGSAELVTSGAHFNPAVTAIFALRKELSVAEAFNFAVVQMLGAILGVLAAHLPFEPNGRSRVYRVLFASRSAFEGCSKVDGPYQSCQRGGGLTRTGRSRQRDRAPIGPPGIA